MSKKEKKEKVFSVEDELLKEIDVNVNIIDPTDKPKPKEKF